MKNSSEKIEFCPICSKILIEKKFGTKDNGCIFNICGDYLNCSYSKLVKLFSTHLDKSEIQKEEKRYKVLLKNFIERENIKNQNDLKQTSLDMTFKKNSYKKNSKLGDTNINTNNTDISKNEQKKPKYPIAIEKIISKISLIKEDISDFKISDDFSNLNFQKNQLRGIDNKISNNIKLLRKYISKFPDERDIINSYIRILNNKKKDIDDLFHGIKLKERALVKDKYQKIFNSDTLLKENLNSKYFLIDEISIGLHIIEETEYFNTVNQEKEQQRQDYLKKLAKSNLKKKDINESYKLS